MATRPAFFDLLLMFVPTHSPLKTIFVAEILKVSVIVDYVVKKQLQLGTYHMDVRGYIKGTPGIGRYVYLETQLRPCCVCLLNLA